MSYKLVFLKQARKEWEKLNSTIREQFKKKLRKRLNDPRIEADSLRGASDLYKIKLKQSGFRLVYRVIDDRIEVEVISVGKRDKKQVYEKAFERIDKL